MFERLAGKFLSRLLSKYFITSDESSSSPAVAASKRSKHKPSQTAASLGVWSGFVSLSNLQVRVDVVNAELKRKGVPVEILQCTLGRVEMTVPWAKLGGNDDDDDAVVVLVVDGVHALLRTNYEFDDAKLREAAIDERRQQLLDSEVFSSKDSSSTTAAGETSSSGLSGFLQKRIAEGLLKDVMEKLHIHLRDVHIRLEDVDSDPSSPFACGITLESLHMQADDDASVSSMPRNNGGDSPSSSHEQQQQQGDTSTMIRKVAQVNHFAVYWNPLDYGDGLAPELSILHQTESSVAALTQALDKCISRRVASSPTSPVRQRPAHVPLHSFLLVPMDAACHVCLSTTPKNLERGPALIASLHMDIISLQVRDFQCAQAAIFLDSVKEYKTTASYRKYRPVVSAKQDPKAWWVYLITIIRIELRESNMRWSWTRFQRRFRRRKRYCELYERKMRHADNSGNGSASRLVKSTTFASQNSISELDLSASTLTAPDEGAGPSSASNGGSLPLSEDEANELQEVEDGVRGDLSVYDIVFFRALVNARLAGKKSQKDSSSKPSRLRRMMSSLATEDMETEEEYERLMAYLEKVSSARETSIKDESSTSTLIAVSIQTYLDSGSVTLYAPLPSTEDLDQHRRIQQRFLEFSIKTFHTGYFLMGNYSSFRLQISLDSFVGTEIRSNMQEYRFIARLEDPVEEKVPEEASELDLSILETPPHANRTGRSDEECSLVYLDISRKPPQSQEYDFGLTAQVEAVELQLLPDCEWPVNLKKILLAIPSSQSKSSFWEDISMARVNAMTSAGAGLLLKAETAVFKHRKIDVDIRVDCPILRIGDVGGSTLSIDLGRAHFTTERLAGVATGKFIVPSSMLDQDGPDRASLAAHATSAPATVSPRRRSERWSFGSAATIDGNGFTDRSVRSTGEDALRLVFTGSMDEADEPYETNHIHSSFYDTFQLQLWDISIYLVSKNNHPDSKILKDLDVRVLIDKSVLPADHTLSKMKAQCVVGDVDILLNEGDAFELCQIFRWWNGTFSSAPATKRPRSRSVSRRLVQDPTISRTDHRDSFYTYDEVSEASSFVDENEFMDAVENEHEEGSNPWFEDRWVAETESVLGSEARSVRRVKQHRKPRSVSDVSSISDMSHRKQRWSSGDYLSAENLARLEEQRDEENSLGSSASDGSEDSFRSAVSLGGQVGVAEALQQDILRLEEEIDGLRAKLETLNEKTDPYTSTSSTAMTSRRVARRAVRLELDRSLAELRALQASHQEITEQLLTARELNYDEQLDGHTSSVQDMEGHPGNQKAGVSSELTARAMTLLKASRKRRRKEGKNEAFQHSLTSDLNREIFHLTLVLPYIAVRVIQNEVDRDTDAPADTSAIDLCFRRTSFGLLKRTIETKLYASIDHAHVGYERQKCGLPSDRIYICYGGTQDEANPTLLSSLYPQYITSAISGTRLLRLALHVQKRRKLAAQPGPVPCLTQLRVLVGDIEVCPDVVALKSFVGFARKLPRQPQAQKSSTKAGSSCILSKLCAAFTGEEVSDRDQVEHGHAPQYLDASLHLAAFRARLGHSTKTFGAFAVSETSLRYVRAVTGCTLRSRSQLEMKCGNVQLLETNEHVPSAAIELLGRRDPYQPLLNIRARAQLVPRSLLGGWVVESHRPELSQGVKGEGMACNLHVGIRSNSAYLTASTRGIDSIANFLAQAMGALKGDNEAPGVSEIPKEVSVLTSNGDHSLGALPIRWRIDFLSKKNSVLFPRQMEANQSIHLPQAFGSSLILPVSFHVYAEEATGKHSIKLRSVISDLSLLRSTDDWPIIEPLTVRKELVLPFDKLSVSEEADNLVVPVDFTWHDRPFDGSQAVGDEDADIRSTVSISPLRINLSPEICRLVRETLAALSLKNDRKNRSTSVGTKERPRMDTRQAKAALRVDGFECRLLRESGRNANISLAESLLSLVMEDIRLNAVQDAFGIKASLSVRDASLDDLSVLPGVRILGRDAGVHPDILGPSFAERSHFVQLHLSVQQPSSTTSTTITVGLQWDHIQCIVLPSLVDSILTFQRQMSSRLPSKEVERKKEKRGGLGLPFGSKKLIFSLRTKGFECILPARDLASYIKQKPEDTISVVTFRWSSTVSGKVLGFDMQDLNQADIVDQLRLEFEGESEADSELEHLRAVAKEQLGFAMSPEEQDLEVAEVRSTLVNALSLRTEVTVESFQILRTTVRKLPFRTAAAGDAHVTPYHFVVQPPSIGEQRITNPFGFRVKYSLIGAQVQAESHLEAGQRFAVAQLFEVSVDFVDALIYIRQSSGGMNDAIRVSVKPIQNIVSAAKTEDAKRDASTGSSSSLIDSLKNATTVCYIRAEGIRITCVPGGATRLTESPIVKGTMSEIRFGLAITSVQKESLLALASVYSETDRNLIESGVPINHAMLGGWFSGIISASYHNRRLVAWEPFVEPWGLNAQVGVDMVEAAFVSPSLVWILPAPPEPESVTEKAGERMRDFGRLLRSPFKGDSREKDAAMPGVVVRQPTDLCYLLLALSGSEAMKLAVFPSRLSTEKLKGAWRPPGERSASWLQAFGHPERALQREPNRTTIPPVLLYIADSKPLYINITGAFIENMQGYLLTKEKEKGLSSVPHLIRNDSGLTIRFQEVLDVERIRDGERANKITVQNGREVPLSLKRSKSQSCDPHRAFVVLELGNFEDTAGRVSHHDQDTPKGFRSSRFFFKINGKIPVDTVGVSQYAVRRNAEHPTVEAAPLLSVGFVIVRVALQGGTKVVSVESPLLLKNNSDADLLCEFHDRDGVSLLWRSIIPGAVASSRERGYVPIPVDLVHAASYGAAVLSAAAADHGVDLSEVEHLSDRMSSRAVKLPIPPPFSKKSMGRGLVRVAETRLPILFCNMAESEQGEFANLNMCGLRIGSLQDRTYGGKGVQLSIPEQRMILFRPPVVIRNYLPVSIDIQVRSRSPFARRGSARYDAPLTASGDRQGDSLNWESLGVVGCGESVSWMGAIAAEKIELRVKLYDKDEEASGQFPQWSSAVVIPAEPEIFRSSKSDASETLRSKLKIVDTGNRTLPVSVALDHGSNAPGSDSAPLDDIRWFGSNFAASPRLISLYVPFWIVDATAQDLEFMSNTAIAGQISRCSMDDINSGSRFLRHFKRSKVDPRRELGLVELLQGDELGHLAARPPFEVIMIGDDRSTRLSMRTRLTRSRENGQATEFVSPWSDPISLRGTENTPLEVTVEPAISGSESLRIRWNHPGVTEPLALRSNLLKAPDRFGGNLGTRLIHLVSLYQIVNETGRELEIATENGKAAPVTVGTDGSPVPFHFDDTRSLIFRPKEYGWEWSGSFRVKKKRREVSLRLIHKLKGFIIIVEVELVAGKLSPGYTLIFREASHPPFRLENHTMHPLYFGQSAIFRDENGIPLDVAPLENTLLPYHHADYAWDEPDAARRSLFIETTSPMLTSPLDEPAESKDGRLGRFVLERIAPGTELKLKDPRFRGEIVADGPTRVLRINDASLPREKPNELGSLEAHGIFQNPKKGPALASWVALRFSQGAGISIVDYSPQELLYVRLQDISFERTVERQKESFSFSIGSVSVDNQLWVTPYPVMVKMGRHRASSTAVERRRRRRQNAVSVSLRHALNEQGRLIILDNLEIGLEPIIVSVDGYLSELIWKMAKEATGSFEPIVGRDAVSSSQKPRDFILKTILGMPDGSAALKKGRAVETSSAMLRTKSDTAESDAGFLPTTAAAVKLLLKPRSSSVSVYKGSSLAISKPLVDNRGAKFEKFYIERFRVSTVKTEFSWSGPLPSALISLPAIMRPALTFESLPVLLRPFSSSHTYGTLDDIAQEVKSHYLSIWRVVDVLVGLSFRPTFLLRAFIYTWRESCAHAFDSLSKLFSGFEEKLLGFAEVSSTPRSLVPMNRTQQSGPLFAVSSIFHNSSVLASTIASLVRYGGTSESARSLVQRSIRARNPRLFEHVDGKDLLVEYVEGENAGKALLSRVRMGRHLGEGYIFHVEDAHAADMNNKSQTKVKPLPLICMLTSERLLLLNGDRDVSFCAVVWELVFENLVNVEIEEYGDPSCDLVKLWYLADTRSAVGNMDDRLAKYANAMVGDSELGLEILLCKYIILPSSSVRQLRIKLATVWQNQGRFGYM